MTDASYGITRSLGKVSFEDALDRVTAALAKEGFGVLTEIDVKATLKKKLDVDFRKYRILGACNVVVLEEDDGTVTVSAVKPSEMFRVVDNATLESTAQEVEAKLVRAIELT